MSRPPDFEEFLDLTGTLQGISELVQPADDGWQPEMHIEQVGTRRLRMWFGPDPLVIYRLTVEVEEEET